MSPHRIVAMRTLLLVVMLGGVAAADALRECHLQNAAVVVNDLGCYDTLRWEGDYAYGTRVCLIRSDQGVCSGVAFVLEGPPRWTPIRLDHVSCGGTDAAVTFAGTWVTYSLASQRNDTPLSFTGKLADDKLRGTFVLDGEKIKVAWKRARKSFDTARHIRKSTARACKKQPT